jgi:hypothetical protein
MKICLNPLSSSIIQFIVSTISTLIFAISTAKRLYRQKQPLNVDGAAIFIGLMEHTNKLS